MMFRTVLVVAGVPKAERRNWDVDATDSNEAAKQAMHYWDSKWAADEEPRPQTETVLEVYCLDATAEGNLGKHERTVIFHQSTFDPDERSRLERAWELKQNPKPAAEG